MRSQYTLYANRSRGCWVSDGDKCSLCVSSLPRKCQMGGHQVTHEFLYIPECPVPLLGRDLLSKLGAQMTFPPLERPTLRVGSTTYLLFLSVTPQDEWRLHDLPEGKPDRLNSGEREFNIFPEVWAEDNHHNEPPTRYAPSGLQNKSWW